MAYLTHSSMVLLLIVPSLAARHQLQAHLQTALPLTGMPCQATTLQSLYGLAMHIYDLLLLIKVMHMQPTANSEPASRQPSS